MRRRGGLGVIIALLVGAALVFVPLPMVALEPGPIPEVPPRVSVEGIETTEISGDYRLTTVRLRTLTAVGVLRAAFDGDRELRRREEVIPPDVDEEEYLRRQAELFDETAQVAAAWGLRAAGYDVVIEGRGAEVHAIADDSAADAVLRVGDVIVAVDGEPVRVAADLVAAMAERQAGDVVTVDLLRDGAPRQADITLTTLPELDRAGLGVAVVTAGLRVELPATVEVERGRIAGPSGGLMVALTVYDLADEVDLAAGRLIAGSGTINADGLIGAVGGIPQKVTAARRAGADVFLVPMAAADEARAAAGNTLEVIAVRHLDDAIAALHPGGQRAAPAAAAG